MIWVLTGFFLMFWPLIVMLLVCDLWGLSWWIIFVPEVIWLSYFLVFNLKKRRKI
jgi:hypothetical protein